MSLLARKSALLSHARRTLATAAVAPKRVGGDISDAFSSLLGKHEALAPRFANLKQSLWRDEMLGEWKDVLGQLEIETSRISMQGSKVSRKKEAMTPARARPTRSLTSISLPTCSSYRD